MFTDLTYVKTFLWITGTDNDAQLTAILNGVEAWFEWKVWDLRKNEKTEEIETYSVKKNNLLALSNKKVDSLTSINWTSYTGVKWTDYAVKYDDTVIVNDLYSYISNLAFDFFEVSYMSGYDNIPVDVQNAIAWLVWLQFYSEGSWMVKSEKSWPRTIQYAVPDFSEDSFKNLPQVVTALSVVEKYRVLHFKYSPNDLLSG